MAMVLGVIMNPKGEGGPLDHRLSEEGTTAGEGGDTPALGVAGVVVDISGTNLQVHQGVGIKKPQGGLQVVVGVVAVAALGVVGGTGITRWVLQDVVVTKCMMTFLVGVMVAGVITAGVVLWDPQEVVMVHRQGKQSVVVAAEC